MPDSEPPTCPSLHAQVGRTVTTSDNGFSHTRISTEFANDGTISSRTEHSVRNPTGTAAVGTLLERLKPGIDIELSYFLLESWSSSRFCGSTECRC